MTSAPLTAPEKYTLLVVDDEEGPRQSLRMVFRREFDVQTFATGTEALAFARANKVHLAILDIRMADLSGIEVLQGLKEIDARIEVLMLTAFETLETARQALRLGACDYLSKPFDLSTIRDAATRALHLRKISDNLSSTAHRLEQLTAELDDTSLREEMARTTSELYASVLHDINNPLTVISGFVQLLENRLGRASVLHGADLNGARDDVDAIARQVNTCTSIASRYLRFINRRHLPEQKVPINQILTDVHTLVKNHPSAAETKVSAKMLETDVTPSIDSTDLVQILLNLAINACQHSGPNAQVWLIAERVEQMPAIETHDGLHWLGDTENLTQSPLVSLTVLDSGPGIPPERLIQVFEPYFTTKTDADGTGLGLAIVARLVRAAGGLLQVRSRPGEGASFTLYLRID